MEIFKLIAVNPMTKWFQWLLLRYKLKKKNKTLKFGYLAKAEDCVFSLENHIFPFARLFNVSIGNFTYVGGSTSIKNAKIGHFTSIAADCRIGLGIHPTNLISTHPVFYSNKREWSFFPKKRNDFEEYKDIYIGSDVWIGTNVIIVDGVKVGNGAIIAANAVVTKNVGPYEIVGGTPAKFIKHRFNSEKIKKLESIKWWDWDLNIIKKNKDKFLEVNTFFND
ncbi:CatB-related O-acetyltransferase [Lutibacter holmesii]|uniref:CatB-related O-acetyltransferase n=1 Tax=Lutibacter holmesii TaxID=1137985 RepID=A0ABW3WSC9_9FLAO